MAARVVSWGTSPPRALVAGAVGVEAAYVYRSGGFGFTGPVGPPEGVSERRGVLVTLLGVRGVPYLYRDKVLVKCIQS